MCEAAASESTWIKCDSWEAKQEHHILTRIVLERFSSESGFAFRFFGDFLLGSICGRDSDAGVRR
jgi:hypothetical protein